MPVLPSVLAQVAAHAHVDLVHCFFVYTLISISFMRDLNFVFFSSISLCPI